MENLGDKIERLLAASRWTDEDREWLLQYLDSSDDNQLKAALLEKLRKNTPPPMDPDLSEKMLRTIHDAIGVPGGSQSDRTRDQRDRGRRPRTITIPLYTVKIAAAILIGLLLTGAWLILRTAKTTPSAAIAKNTPASNDALPGKDKAILTLADGTVVSLDDAHNGTLAQQGNTKVFKLNGRLSYNSAEPGAPIADNKPGAPMSYNTIATPRGGQYQVILPDGSQVWLNAASSLRFPTAFSGKERRVEVTGEAYFEIAKNSSMPFTVAIPSAGGSSGSSAAGGSEIKVLGTHFNVTAYTDDALLKTTLLEGAIKFVSNGHSTLLDPGQQSRLTKGGQLDLASDIDVSQVIAWKNGIFHFEGADIETVMKQLSRWYDVDVIYGSKKASDLFYADIPRNTRLSDALKALALTGKVDFKIENKKIMVNL
jgi:ferric-dicitrate binding protein FerR (iron transport regulator)